MGDQVLAVTLQVLFEMIDGGFAALLNQAGSMLLDHPRLATDLAEVVALAALSRAAASRWLALACCE